jgi:hypothetical protein
MFELPASKPIRIVGNTNAVVEFLLEFSLFHVVKKSIDPGCKFPLQLLFETTARDWPLAGGSNIRSSAKSSLKSPFQNLPEPEPKNRQRQSKAFERKTVSYWPRTSYHHSFTSISVPPDYQLPTAFCLSFTLQRLPPLALTQPQWSTNRSCRILLRRGC